MSIDAPLIRRLGVTAVMLPELSFDEQIALCTSLDIRYYQYRPRIIPGTQRQAPFSNWGNHKFDLTPERLVKNGRQLTRRLRDAGMAPWGTLPDVSIDAPEDMIKLHLDGAREARAKCMRCQPPVYPRRCFSYHDFLEKTIARYQAVIDAMAAPLGIKLIIETHAGSLACSPALAWNICRHFSNKHMGVIVDLPNFAREGGIAPVLAYSVLGAYIDCLHVGGYRQQLGGPDETGARTPDGAFCGLDASTIHIPTWLSILEQTRLNPPLIIEDFTPGVSGRQRLANCVRFLRNLHLHQAGA